MKVRPLISNTEALAQKMGWTLERARGYIEGATLRKTGVPLPSYYRGGISDYVKGLRAGYDRGTDHGWASQRRE